MRWPEGVPGSGRRRLGDGDSASVWSEQAHGLQETHSTQFSEPHPLTVSTMQRLQQWQDRPFNAAVFAGYADPRYDATIATMSKYTVFGIFPVEGVSTWSFEVSQQWSNGINANIEEQWGTVFNFVGGRVDRTVGLSGDFHIASVTQPIPEPSSVALLVVGLGCIAWRMRGRWSGTARRGDRALGQRWLPRRNWLCPTAARGLSDRVCLERHAVVDRQIGRAGRRADRSRRARHIVVAQRGAARPRVHPPAMRPLPATRSCPPAGCRPNRARAPRSRVDKP